MFIKLTVQNTKERVCVNMDDIAFFKAKPTGGTTLFVRNLNSVWHIEESFEYIFEMLTKGWQT